MRKNNNEVRLSGEQAKRFNKFAKHPDPAVNARKNSYLDHINETTNIKSDGSRTIVSVNTDKKFKKSK